MMGRTKRAGLATTAAALFLLACVFTAVAGEPEPPTTGPRLVIVEPAGGQTRERVVTIRGTAEGIAAKRIDLFLNGIRLSVPRDGNAFATTQVLAPGPNEIRVRAAAPNGRWVSDAVALHALVPPKDLRVTLTWDTPGTDVDLWVTGPDDEKISYQNKQGKAGGTLDTDVTTGYGPETYTQARAEAGTYRIQAHYYGGRPPTRVTVTVVRGEGSPKEERHVFRGVLLVKGEIVEVGELVVAR